MEETSTEVNKEAVRMDEDTVSKTAAPNTGVTGSIPVASVAPLKKEEPTKVPVIKAKLSPVTLQYKLNLYTSNGQLRSDIGKAAFTEISRKWGDIVRAISNNRFQTLDEICNQVWEIEKRTFNRGHDRTRPQIEECVAELIQFGGITVRTP